MIYKVNLVFISSSETDSLVRELNYSFGCYEDLLEFLDTLSVRDDLSQIHIFKIEPNWYNMTEVF